MIEKIDFNIEEMHSALSSIILQIKKSKWVPEIILSINRGGCVPGVYLSHAIKVSHKVLDVQLRDSDNKPNLEVLEHSINKYSSILIIDDINDTGATFNFITKNIGNKKSKLRFAALVENTSSNFTSEFKGKIIDKSKTPSWIIFPWEKV
jgi:hypoxanthine phosphoribosyltransferase|tara:strand:+ start:42 stop:491 length:450 start_codon:yes stop_codon:yes gene_type:complete